MLAPLSPPFLPLTPQQVSSEDALEITMLQSGSSSSSSAGGGAGAASSQPTMMASSGRVKREAAGTATLQRKVGTCRAVSVVMVWFGVGHEDVWRLVYVGVL